MSETSPFTVKKKGRILDAVETETVAKPSSNFKDSREVGMTFNMPVEWHTEFKMRSVQDGISMKELLMRSFDAYKSQNR